MRRLLLLGNILVAAGVLFLARPAADLATGMRAQSTALSGSLAPAPRSRPGLSPPPREGEALGRLEVPRIGLDLVVFEGVSDAILRKGPGHLPGTAWPGRGASGNCVIAGHRDSFFRGLADARKDDVVRFHGPSGISTYRLGTRQIVRPEDLSVIGPTTDARLTLITCYPFSWIGSAPYRLVWDARPIEESASASSLVEGARISEGPPGSR